MFVIKDIELYAQGGHKLALSRQFYVKFSIGDTIRETPTVEEKKKSTRWDTEFFLDGVDTSILRVEVYEKHQLRKWKKDELVGGLTCTIEEITGKLKDGVFKVPLCKNASDGSDLTGNTIKFTFAPQSSKDTTADEQQAIAAASKAKQGVSQLGPLPAAMDLVPLAIDTGTGIVAEVKTFESTWGVLLNKLELFDKIVTDIVMIHPYASMAWSVISVLNKALINQKHRDERIIGLASTMGDVLTFVDDTQTLQKIKKCTNTIKLLLQQVTECGHFIAEYTKSENFLARAAKHTIFDVDAQITDYESKLRGLKSDFLEGVALQTGIIVVRMMNVVQDIGEAIVLRDLPRAASARFVREKGCLPGTRESFIQELCDILNDPAEDAPRVCLVTGVAGSGKSAVAHSIARLYDEQNRLGSSFCFSSVDRGARNTRNLFTTIARDLCDHDEPFKSALLEILKANPTLSTSTSPSEQVEQFVAEPSKRLDAIGPLVIVIDALDESGDRESRGPILKAISEQITSKTLPSNLRFLITARPESDILAKLRSGPHLVHKQMSDVLEESVDNDIEKFIHDSLDEYPELETSYPNGEWCRLLVRHSQHLFQWASTACKFIQEVGTNPRKQFKLLLQSEDSTSMRSLDELYQAILNQLFPSENNRRSFRDVMAVVLALHEPLSLASLSALFCSNEDLDVLYVIKPMGALLDGVLDKDKPVRPLHTSFRDFLLDEYRSSTFHVLILSNHSLSLGQALVTCMREKLHFNICGLKNCQQRNVVITDLDNRVKIAIPPQLSYSCQYWMTHLQQADCTPELLNDITCFFKDFFLYWLEAISLLSHTFQASPIISALEACTMLSTWAKDHPGQEITTLASEASRFIQVFYPILRGSTPHLYLSALSQTPSSSPLCKLWLGHLQKHIPIGSGHIASWPVEVHSLQGHEDPVCSVAYSPDGKHIVSGSYDKTIRVWDATTGETIAGPFQGHGGAITSVVYSSDGKHIISGSEDNTIRIWDATTGDTIADSFQGHEYPITSVAYSSERKHIVSGSYDSIRVWDATTGNTIVGPLQKHSDTITTVAYSPKGEHIVTGSYDMTIMVLDATTGDTIVGPFMGHIGPIASVAYSPNGKHIVSGSHDKTIRVWGAITGDIIADPFKGHKDWVISVAYSPNGKHIVSGSHDKTIRVWDAITGDTIVGPFQEHTHWIRSVAYSPDEKHIALSSDDKTIRVWDVTTGDSIVGPFQGHTDLITSVVYSPDGKHIITVAGHNTIRVWNATTGETITGPFQRHTDLITSIAYSPDGKHVVSGSNDMTVMVWDATTGDTITGLIQGHKHLITSVAYSPNGKHIISGSYDKTIRIWDATTGDTIADPFQEHTDLFTSIAYSSDGKHIVSGSQNGTIRVWDVTTGNSIRGPFQGHIDSIESIAYSSDGKHIVSSSYDNTIRVWDTTTGAIVGLFQAKMNGFKCISYSPYSKNTVIELEDKSIQMWNIQTYIFYSSLSIDDGWIQSSNGDVFGWVAPWNRHFNSIPVCHSLICLHDSCQATIDKFLLGESWMSCWNL